MPARRFLVLAIVLAGGVLLAWWGVPAWLTAATLADIGSPDSTTRETAWASLAPRAMALLDRINDVLAGASDDALTDGADELRRLGLWSWDAQPADLVTRELRLRAASEEAGQQTLAVRTLHDCPLETTLPFDVVETLSASRMRDVRMDAVDAAAAWAGAARLTPLAGLQLAADAEVRRAVTLLFAMAEPSGVPPAAMRDDPDHVEAVLLGHVLARPGDVAVVLDRIENDAVSPRPAYAIALRYATDPAAHRALEAMADEGDRTAVHVLQARSPSRDEAQARMVVIDDGQPPWMRRLAAWRWPQVSRDTLDEILALAPAEPDGSVFAAVLLAERRLPADDAAALAETWIRSFDDDFKRAGALLAALLGRREALLAEAYDVEDRGTVRTTQRLALFVADAPLADGVDGRELAYRSLHRPHGDFAPDVLLCLLAAGDIDAVSRLATRPVGDDWRLSVQQRGWLVERFVPAWHERLGRPVGGDIRALHLHFDLVAALHRLEARRLRHDPDDRTFR